MSSVCASGSLVRGDVVCCFSHILQRLYLPKCDVRLLAGGKDMTYVWPSTAMTGSSIKVNWKVQSQSSSATSPSNLAAARSSAWQRPPPLQSRHKQAVAHVDCMGK
jgi:hypothetical protein